MLQSAAPHGFILSSRIFTTPGTLSIIYRQSAPDEEWKYCKYGQAHEEIQCLRLLVSYPERDSPLVYTS